MEVIVYSTPFCGKCEQVKAHLASQRVRFVVRDVLVDEDAAEFLARKGVFSAPAVSIDGELVTGLDLRRLDEVLTRAGGDGTADGVPHA